jgi:hypothetical protein
VEVSSKVVLSRISRANDGVFSPLLLEEERLDDFWNEQKRVSSFASSVSSLTKNLSGFGDEPTTPSRTSGASSEEQQLTPREVQLHFQLEAANCSPIPGIPEEDGDVSRSRDSSNSGRSFRPMPDMAAFDGDVSGEDSSTTATSSPRLLCPP